MPDIQLRYDRDMLVLSSPVDVSLAKQGIDVENDLEFISLLEPEALADVYRLQSIAGAQCFVANTRDLCQSRLLHKRLADRADELVEAALDAVRASTPQHILAEIGPCGLPLDPGSETSLEQTRLQYAGALSLLKDAEIDAIFFNGMRSVADARCALSAAIDYPQMQLMLSVNVDESGLFDGLPVEEFLATCDAADVIGIATKAPLADACATVKRIFDSCHKPILVQLDVKVATDLEKRRASLGGPVPGKPYALPDNMIDAAAALRKCGAQFLRAVGEATPAYTAGLAATVTGLNCKARA